MKLDEFFVTGDPIIYGADASIVLVTLAIIFVLTKYKKWKWLWDEWLTTVDHKNRSYVYYFCGYHVIPWWYGWFNDPCTVNIPRNNLFKR